MPDHQFRVGEWVVRPDLNALVAGSDERRIEPKAMDVLVHLARRKGEVVSKRELLSTVWDGTRVVDGVLARCISQLRRALGDDPRAPRFIETVARRGYRLLTHAAARPDDGVARTLGLAVLPFVNLSGDPGQEHIGEATAELLSANLAMLRGLRVTSRTSALRCRDARATAPEIALQLCVDYVVEGSTLRSPTGDVHVIVKLVDARADAHVWAREYRRHYDALLGIAADAARAIAGELHVDVPSGIRLVTESSRVTPRANDAYLRGLYALAKRTPEDMRLALRLFQEAIERDPKFALGYAGAGVTSAIMAVYALLPPAEAFAAARSAAQKAIELAPDLGEAYCALAAPQLFEDWDFAAAERSLRRCVAASPSYALGHLALADALVAQGRTSEALREISEAAALGPMDPGINMNVGDHLMFAGFLDAAVSQYREAVGMEPRLARGHARLARACAMTGLRAEALEALERAEALGDPGARGAAGAFVLARCGRIEEARKHLDVAARAPSSAELAQAWAALGDRDEAFRWLDVALDQRVAYVVFLAVEPALDPLRDDPRFAARLRRLGVAPAGRPGAIAS
ncbi:MAG TPA: winged helix-turn-helix domain-containing protein [Anaeromyxobacteraceae bacterium]|nr:winged helix-turn-helix domain-containing protein [Anaeromyxobacteraceae bacterium]